MKSRALDILDKNSGGFGFLSVFFDLIGNREFKRAELSSLYTQAETSDTSFWRALSAVGSQTGEELVANVLHFVDGVADPDTCKVPQLQSMAEALGTTVDGWASYCSMPLQLQKLVDFLSMKRSALIDPAIAKPEFIEMALSGANVLDIADRVPASMEGCTDFGELSDRATGSAWRKAFDLSIWRNHWLEAFPETSSYWEASAIPSAQVQAEDDKLDRFVQLAISTLIVQKVSQTYSDLQNWKVYEKLSDSVLLSNFTLPDYNASELSIFKIENGIPNSFDEKAEADAIENGQTTSADYSSRELSLVQMELDRRELPLYADQLKTRYRYYREKDVQEWSQFVERENSWMFNLSELANLSSYSLDSSYYRVQNRPLCCQLFYVDPTNERIHLSAGVVQNVARRLAGVVASIREAREQIKLNSQQLSIRGSKQHLDWLLREYLRQMASKMAEDIQASAIDGTEIDIIRYYDPNSYFNVSSEADAKLLLDEELSGEVASHLSELNEKPSKLMASRGASKMAAKQSDIVDDMLLGTQVVPWKAAKLSKQDISAFYFGRLSANLSGNDQRDATKAARLDKFLSTAIDVGAENSFDYFGRTVFWDEPDLSVETSKLSIELAANLKLLSTAWTSFESKINQLSQYQLSDYCYPDKPVGKQLSNLQTDFRSFSYIDQLEVYQMKLFDDVAAMQTVLLKLDMAMDKMAISSVVSLATAKATQMVEALSAAQLEARDQTDTFLKRRGLDELELLYAEHSPAAISTAELLSSLYPDGFAPAGSTSRQQMESLLSSEVFGVAASMSALSGLSSYPLFVSVPTASELSASALSSNWGKSMEQLSSIAAAAVDISNFFKTANRADVVSGIADASQAVASAQARASAIFDLSSIFISGGWIDSSVYIETMPDSLTAFYDEAQRVSAEALAQIEDTDVARYRKKLFGNYSLSKSDTPWYNLPNTWHPSFLVHPDVESFYRENPNQAIPEVDYFSLDDAKAEASAMGDVGSWLDADGYLKDVWDSPFRGNQSWLARYEESQHEGKNGKKSPCVDYDGLFYPPALLDLISSMAGQGGANDKFYAPLSALGIDDPSKISKIPNAEKFGFQLSDMFTGYGLSGNFIAAINGAEIEDSSVSRHAQWNPWYSHLDLSEAECAAIAERFCRIDNIFYNFNRPTNLYKIAKYGVDAYSNAWTLLREDKSDGGYSQILWVRAANHPIGFPAFIADPDSKLLDISPVYSPVDLSKIVSREIVQKNLTYYFSPQIEDFELTPDGRTIAIAFKQPPEAGGSETIVVASIASDETLPLRTVLDGTKFSASSFYSGKPGSKLLSLVARQDQIGVLFWERLASDSEDSSVQIYGACYDGNQKTMLTPVVLPVPAGSEPAADVRDGKIAIAWPRWKTAQEKFNDYLGGLTKPGVRYEGMEDVVVETREYKLVEKNLVETKAKPYAMNASAGYFGLLGNVQMSGEESCEYVNDFSKSVYAQKELDLSGFCRFQILADQMPDGKKAIDFRSVADARMDEKYVSTPISALVKQTTPSRTFYSANYFDARKLEGPEVESDHPVCGSREFGDLLSGKHVQLRQSEHNFRLDTSKFSTNADIASSNWPVLFWSPADSDGKPKATPEAPPTTWLAGHCVDEDEPDQFADDNCVVKFKSNHLFPDLSVSWKRWNSGQKDEIQLDFNTAFYKAIDGGVTYNQANQMRLFLNLEKAGDWGKLNVYRDPIASDFTQLGSYYLKNVSDSQPKFILSADFDFEVADGIDSLAAEKYEFTDGQIKPQLFLYEMPPGKDGDTIAVLSQQKTVELPEVSVEIESPEEVPEEPPPVEEPPKIPETVFGDTGKLSAGRTPFLGGIMVRDAYTNWPDFSDKLATRVLLVDRTAEKDDKPDSGSTPDDPEIGNFYVRCDRELVEETIEGDVYWSGFAGDLIWQRSGYSTAYKNIFQRYATNGNKDYLKFDLSNSDNKEKLKYQFKIVTGADVETEQTIVCFNSSRSDTDADPISQLRWGRPNGTSLTVKDRRLYLSESMSVSQSTLAEEFTSLQIKPDTKYQITIDIENHALKMTVDEYGWQTGADRSYPRVKLDTFNHVFQNKWYSFICEWGLCSQSKDSGDVCTHVRYLFPFLGKIHLGTLWSSQYVDSSSGTTLRQWKFVDTNRTRLQNDAQTS